MAFPTGGGGERGGGGVLFLVVAVFATHANCVASEGDSAPSCTFSWSSDLGHVNESIAVNGRCREENANWIESKYGLNAVGVDDRLCGVLNATDPAGSEVCYSKGGDEGVQTAFMHEIKLPNELWYDDYEDPKKTRFRLKRKSIENEWNPLMLRQLESKKDWKFEKVTVLSMSRVVADGSTTDGIIVKALVQFGKASVPPSQYLSEFSAATGEDKKLGKYVLLETDDYTGTTSDPGSCPAPSEAFPYSASDKKGITEGMWTTSGGAAMPETAIATSIDFECPAETWLSDDDDGFDAYDNKYTVLCTALQRYNTPREWPKCLPACEAAPPAAPESTGLEPVEAKTKVPAGKTGSYVCKDPTLGVERSGTEFFEVLCTNISLTAAEYQVPPEDDQWPQCLTRTTTYSPVIPVAIQEMLAKSKSTLERRKARDQFDEDFEVDWGEDWLMKVFLPALILLGLLILILCCLLRNDSNFFYMCRDRNPYLKQHQRLDLTKDFTQKDY